MYRIGIQFETYDFSFQRYIITH